MSDPGFACACGIANLARGDDGGLDVDQGRLTMARESPLGEDLALLFARHTADMHADTPPDSIHMMPRETLAHPAVDFFVLRDGGRALGMAAIKRIAPDHGEIKSMHVLSEARGRGLSRHLVEGLLAHADQHGLTQLSLETGTQAMFAPARSLYEQFGFRECAPFGDYRPDPFSIFMTRKADRPD